MGPLANAFGVLEYHKFPVQQIKLISKWLLFFLFGKHKRFSEQALSCMSFHSKQGYLQAHLSCQEGSCFLPTEVTPVSIRRLSAASPAPPSAQCTGEAGPEARAPQQGLRNQCPGPVLPQSSPTLLGIQSSHTELVSDFMFTRQEHHTDGTRISDKCPSAHSHSCPAQPVPKE